MPLNSFSDARFGGLPDNLRWVLDLQERLNPVIKLQRQFDSIVRPNSLLELVGKSKWADSAFWEASRKMAAVARPIALPSSAMAAAVAATRFDALALKMPPDIGRQLTGLQGVQASFFKDWSALVQLAKPVWLPQIEALQLRFEHALADFADLTDTEQEPEVLQSVAAASASVLTVGTEIVADQQIAPTQLTDLVTALQQLTAAQEKQAVALGQQAAQQQETNRLLVQINQQVTESTGKKLLSLLNTLIAILGLLLAVLAYLESRKAPASPTAPTPAERAVKGISMQLVQATLLPHVLKLLRQASLPRTVARRVALRSHPRRHGAVASQLPPGTVVKLLHTRRQWALVTYSLDEEVVEEGWVLKKYLHKASN